MWPSWSVPLFLPFFPARLLQIILASESPIFSCLFCPPSLLLSSSFLCLSASTSLSLPSPFFSLHPSLFFISSLPTQTTIHTASGFAFWSSSHGLLFSRSLADHFFHFAAQGLLLRRHRPPLCVRRVCFGFVFPLPLYSISLLSLDNHQERQIIEPRSNLDRDLDITPLAPSPNKTHYTIHARLRRPGWGQSARRPSPQFCIVSWLGAIILQHTKTPPTGPLICSILRPHARI